MAKKKPGKGKQFGKREAFLLPENLLKSLEDYLEKLEPKPSKSSYIRHLIEKDLKTRGIYKGEPEEEEKKGKKSG